MIFLEVATSPAITLASPDPLAAFDRYFTYNLFVRGQWDFRTIFENMVDQAYVSSGLRPPFLSAVKMEACLPHKRMNARWARRAEQDSKASMSAVTSYFKPLEPGF